MNASDHIRRYCRTMGALAEQAGLSHGYVKHLAKKRPRSAGREARVLLARAFREQAAQLQSDADALEAGLRPKAAIP